MGNEVRHEQLAIAIHFVHNAFEVYVAVLQRMARKCTKNQNARAEPFF